MKILPVLDVMENRVVRGVAGRREKYRPLESALTDRSDPMHVAEAIRSHFGYCELYLADIDAILGGGANISVLQSLSAAGFGTIVDAGLRRCQDAAAILSGGVQQVVAGLETLNGPAELRRLVADYGATRIVFSLDLRDGRPLGDPAQWDTADPLAIARQAIAAGCMQMIVLDIAHVGTAAGVSTYPLCAAIRRVDPRVTLLTGGGIRNAADLGRIDRSIIDGVLIASALHDGSIGRADLDALR